MLATKLKDKETVKSLLRGKVFIISCCGCREAGFPEKEVREFQEELKEKGSVCGILDTDYICNPENFKVRLDTRKEAAESADTVLVFSCGVGVQTVSEHMPGKSVCAACDTYALPGFQGVTPLTYDCGKCGQCYLNITGGICPITACSKSLLNGQCGGSKDGMCEVDPDMECGWERIYRRLAMVGREDLLKCPVQIRDYAAR